MSKELIWKTIIFLTVFGATEDIATAKYFSRHSRQALKLQIAPPSPLSPRLIWTKSMRGAISNLVLSKNGQVILVSTSPDHDIPGSLDHHFLSKYSANGTLNWQQKIKYPLKDFGVSQDGSLIVLSNYEFQLVGLNSSGKELWTTRGMCKPHILTEPKRIICYHDDDAEPNFAFDILDWQGKKLSSYSITEDVMAFKLSENEKNLAVGLSGGEVVLFGSDFQPLWKKKIFGEIIDLAVANGQSPVPTSGVGAGPSVGPFAGVAPGMGKIFKIAVLIRDVGEKKKQKVVFFDEKGNVIGESVLSFSASQIEASAKADQIFYYGNSKNGQYFGSVLTQDFKENWKHGEDHEARYSGSIQRAGDQIFMGYEHEISAPNGRESRVLNSDFSGKLIWDLLLSRDETAYIYAYRASVSPNLFVIATDDAKLSVYRF